MTSTVSGPGNPRRPGSGNAEDPAVVRRRGPGSETYAAELLLDEEPELDDFASEEDEEDDEDDDDSDDDEVDVDGFEDDDAGELLDEEPRLSLR
jgi:hypothetical protein